MVVVDVVMVRVPSDSGAPFPFDVVDVDSIFGATKCVIVVVGIPLDDLLRFFAFIFWSSWSSRLSSRSSWSLRLSSSVLAKWISVMKLFDGIVLPLLMSGDVGDSSDIFFDDKLSMMNT